MTNALYRPTENLTGKNLNAFTIAAFLVVQGKQHVALLDASDMDQSLLQGLTRPTTIRYWKQNGWLEPGGEAGTLRLTALGIEKVFDRVQGRAKGQSVKPQSVEQWRHDILAGTGAEYQWVQVT